MQSLEPMEVVEGSPVKLQCRVTGKPEPSIEWFRDSQPLKEDKRVKIRFDGELCTLKILVTELDDEGAYKCIAKNAFGSASCASELLVNEPNKKPEFVKKMKPVDVSEGDEARFDVQLVGNPAPDVQWFRGKEKLEDVGRYIVVDDEEEEHFSLIIEDTVASDAGTYKCVATNEEGQVMCKAALAVKEKLKVPEPTAEGESASVSVREGAELCLSVGVKGSTVSAVDWFKDEKKLRKSSRCNIDAVGDKFSLVVLNVKPDDSGTYKCVASSKAGTVTKTFDVNVEGN